MTTLTLPVKSSADVSAQRLHVLLYGEPKTGKTRMAATFPKPLFIDTDRGMLSTTDRPCDYVEPESYEQLKQTVTDLVASNGAGYETIVWDSLTTAYLLVMASVLSLPVKREGVKTEHWDTLALRREQITQADWGLAHERARVMLVDTLKLPCHIVVITHEHVRESKTGDHKGGLALAGQFASTVPVFFDEMFRVRLVPDLTSPSKTKSVLVTAQEGIWMAGDRSGKLAPVDEPHFATLQRKILQQGG